MVTVGIVCLMGLMGLVVDLGWGYYQKQVAQAAADSAVMAAIVPAVSAGTITCNSGGIVCQSATICSASATGNFLVACQYALQNGIPYGNMKIAANTTTPFNGAAVSYWVTATVTQNLTPSFMQVAGFTSATVAASASGAVVSTGGTGGGCIYSLDPSAAQAFYLNGANLSVTCPIYLNSSNTTNAFTLNSANAYLKATGTGGITMLNGAGVQCAACGCNNVSPYTGGNGGTACPTPARASATADPLASLPAPSVGSCNSLTSGGSGWSWSNLSPAQTLNPGVYCGGINIGGGNVTFNPGTYILNGGGLKIQGANTTVSGSGVFFYNTSSGYTAGPLLMSGQPNINFSGPTTGTYEGILFMQDHSVCPSSQHAINGNTNIEFSGSIYLHCTKTGSNYVAQNLLYTGQSTSGHYSALVVDTLQINGMSNLILDPTGGQNTGIGLGGGSKGYLVQ